MDNAPRTPTFGLPGRHKETDLFYFTPEQLGILHNPKDLGAFQRYGGVQGLVEGLRTHRTSGLGGYVRQTAIALTLASRKSTARYDDADDIALIAQRRAVFKDNRLPTKKQTSFLSRVWMAYNDPVLFLLTAAAVVSLAIGLYQTFTTVHGVDNPPVEWVEGVAIITAIVIIVLVGSINDWEKSRQFKKLNEKQLERFGKVIRYGSARLIPGSDIVVGEVVLLEPGDIVPADGILLTGHNVMCDESSATGESELVNKAPGDDVFRALEERGEAHAGDPLPELDPFVLSGTKVLEGIGSFLVTATGTNSTYGKILAQVRESDDAEPTPLQDRLAVLAKYISRLGALIAVLFFLALFIRFLVGLRNDSRSSAEKGKNFIDIVIIALTVLVIAVPEGLPLAVVLSLAFATTRMLKDHNLVRQLKACETMGNATSVCSDKTGTLTENKMSVVVGTLGPGCCFAKNADQGARPIESASSDEVQSPLQFADALIDSTKTILRKSIALNTTAFESKNDSSAFVGSTTESALLTFARDYLGMGTVGKERASEHVAQLIPFSGVRKCMATVITLRGSPGTYRVFIKGAAEALLSKCTKTISNPCKETSNSVVDLTPEEREKLAAIIASYASQSLRVVSLVYRDVHMPDGKEAKQETEFALDYLLEDLVFLGAMGIHDPVRPGVRESITACTKAGVTVRMVTGDNLLTAQAIATECGMLSEGNMTMEGSQFRALSESEKKKVIPDLRVLARSTPDDKRQLVVLLKQMGEIVAVTGDGTNDASAMSAADVSFAMGIAGTEVAKQASSIILMTDDFTSIVKAIMWGRAVNDSVKKFLQFQITITVTSVLLAFVSGIADPGEQSVLTPVQLMWINLFQDTLAALALATDPPQPGVLDRKPEPRKAPLITASMWKTIIGQSIYQTAATLILYFAGPHLFAYETDTEIQQVDTLVFNTYVWLQIFNMYNSRQHDDTLNVFAGVFSNWLFMTVSLIMIGLQILIVFVGGPAFPVVPLTGVQWAVSLVLGLLTLAVGAALRFLPNGPLQAVINAVERRESASGPISLDSIAA
ncbi:calcium-translocating P-type ATPase [Thozetella sp. PMI_491]|nr:calcium-translocating P-type ATPase [Thozetella sp. PMI_491]